MASRICRVFGEPVEWQCRATLHREPAGASSQDDVPGGTAGAVQEARNGIRRTIRVGLRSPRSSAPKRRNQMPLNRSSVSSGRNITAQANALGPLKCPDGAKHNSAGQRPGIMKMPRRGKTGAVATASENLKEKRRSAGRERHNWSMKNEDPFRKMGEASPTPRERNPHARQGYSQARPAGKGNPNGYGAC